MACRDCIHLKLPNRCSDAEIFPCSAPVPDSVINYQRTHMELNEGESCPLFTPSENKND